LRPDRSLHYLADLRHDLARGGITVNTPTDKPVLRTVMQFDGDVQSFVDVQALSEQPAGREQLLASHQTAIAERLGIFSGLRRLGRILHYAALAASGGITLDAMTVQQNTELAHRLLLAAAPTALRYAAPYLLHMMLWPAMARLAAELRQSSTCEQQKLLQRRADRGAV
jgi:hypothetical protein